MSKKILKSHKWEADTIEQIEARCPYCGKYTCSENYEFNEGDKLMCCNCLKYFILGKQI